MNPIKRLFRLVFGKRTPGRCRVCGCTEMDPCYNPAWGTCWWVDAKMTLCSHCASWKIFKSHKTEHCVNSSKKQLNNK